MKKVLGIVLLLVVLVSTVALAAEPPVQANWSFKLTADNGAGLNAMAAGIIGVDSAASDGNDVKDTLPNFVVGSATRGFGMVQGATLLKNEYQSVKSPLDSAYAPNYAKVWNLRIFATPGTVGASGNTIRLFFGTTSLPLAPPATVKNSAGVAGTAFYTLIMVDNKGVVGAPANYDSSKTRAENIALGSAWNVPIPTAVSTNYFSITLPLLQLSAANNDAALAEGYKMQFYQTPEPSSLMAMGAGLMGLVGFAARRRRS